MDHTDSEQGHYEWMEAEQSQSQADELAFTVAVEVHDATFCILDSLECLDGSLAGVIAKAVQDVVEVELRRVL